MPPSFALFHWSPTARRKSIVRKGLCPGSRSRDNDWNPPYVCFSKSPSMAWGLSAHFSDKPESWDLWMVQSNALDGYEKLYQSSENAPTEYRTYKRVMKRDVWYVGTREYKPRKRRR